ncbi:PAS sensor diguanylate cyclase and phophodiesterase [Mizugakiibacter sediminis]|uniref:PAS sensor diguanylate cyclase and phophodiesterase n=1 Tax=Mizugakiibacter sediminis TaxID=1475481 RepID=A0A0K8QMQ1_9GAMM|nr:GGDEF domain-containing response regulator [Mizugakiibacter sediminis]GAP66175.1 PAS sensor diguanylate cyclase and phophodiesterase [Mizugakiibacter sediminis]
MTPRPPASIHAWEVLADARVLAVAATAGADDPLLALLRRCGFAAVRHTARGAEALAQLDADTDVILLDTVLADMDAAEFCERLASRPQPPPVLLMLPAAAARGARPVLPEGVADVLPRPLREVELAMRVSVAARLRRERRERHRREIELQAAAQERSRLRGLLLRREGRDTLTGLYSRRRFEQALEAAVLAVGAGAAPIGLLVLNLDRFRHLRSALGQRGAERLLHEVAALLRAQAGADGLAAQLEGDEFAMLLHGCTPAQTFERAEALRQAIAQLALDAGGEDWSVSASIGVAAVDAQAGAEGSLARAQRAAYVARLRGGNMVHRYRADDRELADQRAHAHCSALLRQALASNGFQLVFQPVVRIADLAVDHYEALVRLVGEHGELLPPGEFIAVAERTGLIHDIDRWVIGAAIDFLQRISSVRSQLALNINLSGRAFQDDRLLPFICRKLDETGVRAERITFEITETAAIANVEATREMVAQLRQLGCRFALDDFGAGFASYSYLKELRVDVLKIDGTFIRNLADDPMDQVLVRSMVDIARALGKQTVAEFVGDQRTLELLGHYGVDYAQGFYVGRPSSALLPRRLRLTRN